MLVQVAKEPFSAYAGKNQKTVKKPKRKGAKKAYGIRLSGPGRVSKNRSINGIHQLHSLTCVVQIFYLGMVVPIAKRFLIVPAADTLHRLRVYLKSQKVEKDENNVEIKWYNKCRRK